MFYDILAAVRRLTVIYEVRKWFDDCDCLYTDDRRVKDLAIQTGELQIVGTYFKSTREHQPFAWDIVGPHNLVSGLSKQFSAARRRMRSASSS